MKKPVISLIAAVGQNGEIGKDGDLIWRISEDLKHFKKITMGGVLIMGRKTYESIGKPLPGRINIVVTSQQNYPSRGIFTASDPHKALQLALCFGKPVFIIGGEKIYRSLLPRADRLYLTLIDADDPDADSYFPPVDLSQWNVVSPRVRGPVNKTRHGFSTFFSSDKITPFVSPDGIAYIFTVWQRK